MQLFLVDVTNEFGPFKNAVDLAGASVAASGAIVSTVLGRDKAWHPNGSGVGTAVTVAIVAGVLPLLGISPVWLRICVAVVALAVVITAAFKYMPLVARYGYQMSTTPGKAKTRRWWVVKGDAYTTQAEAALKTKTLADILPDYGYQPDSIWDPTSRAQNAALLERWYAPMVIGGTLAVAAAAMAAGG